MIDHAPTAVSFHGFAGAFAVALWEQGIRLKAVVEPGGFGVQAIEANRAKLGFDGPIYTSSVFDDIPIVDADILVGNPPCSGFSTLNPGKAGSAKNFRGSASPINDCMWAFVRYAARMNQGRGPLIAAFESVQQAGTQGKELMEQLAEHLRSETGEPFVLHHLFMSGASVGSAQVRRRYFWVASRIPFGIESPNPQRVVTYQDAIGDLVNVPIDGHCHKILDRPTWWSNALRSIDETDGFETGSGTWESRLKPLFASGWAPGENHRPVFQRLHATGHQFKGWTDRSIEREVENIGYSTIMRIRPDEPGRVITGAGGAAYAHYSEDRTLTVRETARLMGFPDWFDWGFAKPQRAFLFLGKQVPVQSWSWLSSWIHAALTGEPGRWTGYQVEDGGSRRFDVTRDFQQVFNLRTRERTDSRPKYVRDEMEGRPA